ncbi:MAG: SDR family oxidoreductase, partial [Proteobacteria bacterium]
KMKAKGWGRIINLVSVHGVVASPFKAAYVSAKHGAIGLTKTVALELADTNITCNAICPGYVRTPLVEGQIEQQAKVHNLPRERVIREVILASQPKKEFIEVEAVGAMAAFLCSDAGSAITGANFNMDGGWTAR